eukprot:1139967-Pelagomonas_calceolata.AAC.1
MYAFQPSATVTKHAEEDRKKLEELGWNYFRIFVGPAAGMLGRSSGPASSTQREATKHVHKLCKDCLSYRPMQADA